MTLRIPFAVLGALALTALTLRPAVSGAAERPTAMKNDPATQKTINDIRNVGTAMYTWYKDEMAPKRSAETHKKAEAAAQTKSVDISVVPEISRGGAREGAGPQIHRGDPGEGRLGEPLRLPPQYQGPQCGQAMGLRSAGRDGQFTGNVYEVGSFSPEDHDQDIPWMDGYFVRWPEAKK